MNATPTTPSSTAPWVVIALGAVASTGVVVGFTGVGYGPTVTVPGGPLGLWTLAADGRFGFAVLTVVAVFALVLAFVALHGLAARQALSVRGAAVAAGLWCLPVMFAQPLFSLDAYSYAAQGQMVVEGLDPYAGGPVLLGGGPLLDAVAPIWRATPAPYGPLALGLLHALAALSGADQVPFVLLLRLVVVGSVAASAAMAVRLALPERAAAAVILVAANPVVVLHLVGGVHLDALLGALAAGVLLAVRHRRWWLASLAAATAFALKVPGVVLVAYVLLRRARDVPGAAGSRLRRVLLVAAGLVGVAVVALVAALGYAALVPNGWGWLGVMGTPGKVRLVYTAPYLLGGLLYGIVLLVHSSLAFTDVLGWARLACGLAGGLLVLDLLLRAREERGWRRSAALVGGALIVVALAAPVIHAWYLAWGLGLVAAGAGDAGRRWMLVLSVAMTFTAMPSPLVRSGAGLALNLALLVVAVAVAATAGGWPSWRERRPPHWASPVRPAARRAG